ncbi:MAG: hypothetical protein KY466_16235 [Gemmatimonadetes bacterium]|nr:hypothetical protein [Gemmatimonadota bacterium]
MPHRLTILGLFFVAAACFREPDPFTVDTDDLAVHVILEGESDSVYAIVETPGNPIENAVVRLIAAGDTSLLAYSAEPCVSYFGLQGPGCHRADLARPIQPGREYALEVILPGGARVTGATVVPLPLSLVSPSVGERIVASCRDPQRCFGEYIDRPPYNIPVATVVFRWPGEGETVKLFATVETTRTFLDGVAYTPAEGGCRLGTMFSRSNRTAADSLVVTIPNISCDVEPLREGRFDSIHARALAYVGNEPFHEYLEMLAQGQTAREASVSVGLEGAWGVFGAITPTSVPITILRDPAPAP